MKHWRLIYLTIPLTVAVFAAILLANEWKSTRPAQGVGSLTGKCQPVPEAVRYAAEAEAVEEEADEYRLDSYTEGESPVPVWWDPEEDMAVEWTDNTTDNARLSESNTRRVIDVGCPDYNIETVIYGWDGHCMESWEMDLFSMIFYKEFWGTSIPCCEAGCDAMLNLWSSGLYGRTMGEVLSAVNDSGYYIFSTYPSVLETDYDPDGLEWCKEFCMERFLNGPTWVDAMYFRLYGYHDTSWSIPLYEIDGVYFSAGK